MHLLGSRRMNRVLLAARALGTTIWSRLFLQIAMFVSVPARGKQKLNLLADLDYVFKNGCNAISFQEHFPPQNYVLIRSALKQKMLKMLSLFRQSKSRPSPLCFCGMHRLARSVASRREVRQRRRCSHAAPRHAHGLRPGRPEFARGCRCAWNQRPVTPAP